MPKFPKNWNGKYQEILVMHQKGVSGKDIADKVGLNEATVCRIMKREVFQDKKEVLQKKINEKVLKIFESEAEMAARRLVRISKTGKPQDRIKLDASKEILYQVGVKPKEVIETITRNYTLEEVESAKKTMQETVELMKRLDSRTSRFVIPKQGENVAKEEKPTQDG